MPDPQITKALIDAALFFELSDAKTINQDAALAALEQLAAKLQLMGAEARRELAAAIRSQAQSYSRHQGFVSALPATLGFNDLD